MLCSDSERVMQLRKLRKLLDMSARCGFEIIPSRQIITFRVSRRRRKMYCGHARLCLSLRGRTPTLLHGPGCNLEAW